LNEFVLDISTTQTNSNSNTNITPLEDNTNGALIGGVVGQLIDCEMYYSLFSNGITHFIYLVWIQARSLD
jgi:hypothetical protein